MIERGGDGPNTQISPVTLQISRFNHDLSRVSCNYDIKTPSFSFSGFQHAPQLECGGPNSTVGVPRPLQGGD